MSFPISLSIASQAEKQNEQLPLRSTKNTVYLKYPIQEKTFVVFTEFGQLFNFLYVIWDTLPHLNCVMLHHFCTVVRFPPYSDVITCPCTSQIMAMDTTGTDKKIFEIGWQFVVFIFKNKFSFRHFMDLFKVQQLKIFV